MISKKHKTIFVHIPKVAGQSIETVFLNDLGLTWETRSELLLRKKTSDEQGPLRLAHLKAKEYVSLGYIDENTFRDYYKFSFVRNPYARTISLYKYLGYSRIISFSAFVKKILPEKIKENDFFFLPQYDYLYGKENTLMVDFVGKLETIEEDIEVVFNEAGLEGATLPHVNKSEKGLKRGLASLAKKPSLIKDIEGRRLVSNIKPVLNKTEKQAICEIYKQDFKYFGYEN
ncbi:MAG: hypothetical protein CMC13_01510 [Flavobacteriaceae bacterium]|nr:hypothetical protein [Flavobacteriaceae bacterium]|tara:strand:- start:157 stop:846 length:690 start_codon:yes stop_codon:yes gene_type:complete